MGILLSTHKKVDISIHSVATRGDTMSDKDVKRIYDYLYVRDSIGVNNVLNESHDACARERLMQDVITAQGKYLDPYKQELWDQNGSLYTLSLVVSSDVNGNRTDTLTRKDYYSSTANDQKLVTIEVDAKACYK